MILNSGGYFEIGLYTVYIGFVSLKIYCKIFVFCLWLSYLCYVNQLKAKEMKNGILNCNLNTYLVKFRWKSANNIFIVQGSGLMDVLKQYDINGVEYIKEFDPSKATFKRVAIKKLLSAFSWETETYLYLQSHYYFK